MALFLGSTIEPVIREKSSFCSSGITQIRRKGAIPAKDWYHSEIHAHPEKSIRRTPRETQWAGGSSPSPKISSVRMASPKKRTADDPIQRPTAAK